MDVGFDIFFLMSIFDLYRFSLMDLDGLGITLLDRTLGKSSACAILLDRDRTPDKCTSIYTGRGLEKCSSWESNPLPQILQHSLQPLGHLLGVTY